jgi:dUTP pyrophosphatase
MRPVIVFEPLYDGVLPPTRATADSAGYDLRAWFAADHLVIRSGLAELPRSLERDGETRLLRLHPGDRAVVPLGFKARLPPGIEAQVRPRSGTTLRLGLLIPNAPGTIDPDYHGEWGVVVQNGTTVPITIAHGERIAQMVLARYEQLDFTAGTVAPTTDRVGGFGSTGR